MISVSEIAKVIHERFPIIATVNVQRVLPNILVIELVSYPIVANIKMSPQDEEISEAGLPDQEIAEFVPEDQKALINQKGYVVATDKENLQLPEIYLVDRKKSVKEYELVMKQSHLKSILAALQIIDEKLHFKVKEIKYFTFAREMHFETESGITLWLDFEDHAENQLNKLIKIINQFDLEKNPPSYFDLRIKNRLIYK